jgi:hypothetical protein
MSGSLFQQTGGSTFDIWKIVAPVGGTFKLNVLAYESTDNTTANAVDSIFQSRHEPERRGYLINDSGSDGLGFID